MRHRTLLFTLMILQSILLYLSASVAVGYLTLRGRLIAVLVGLAVFVIPPVIGALCRTWQSAIALAIAPWWVAVLAHAGTLLGPTLIDNVGYAPFWLLTARLIPLLLSLAFFAVLGGLGWLGSRALSADLAP